MNILQNILNIIIPPRCVICGKILSQNQGFCEECLSNLNFIKGAVCYHCGYPLALENTSDNKHLYCGKCLHQKHPLLKFIRSAIAYDDFSKKLILDFKFYDQTDLAYLLARMMYVAGSDIFADGIDVIIPVPLHYTRLIKRKYNQSSLLAKELGKLSSIKVEYQNLLKIKMTKPQVQCSGAYRLHNLTDAFALKNPKNLKGKKILLVDDVFTTGTTINECAKIIKSAAPKSISCLTVARVL